MKKILTLFLLAFSYLGAVAQSLPSQVEVSYPKIFQKAIVQEAEINKFMMDSKFGQAVKSNRHWIAYSDRSHNKLYKTPGGTATCGELEFNEKVRIAKIEKNGFALVYSEPMESVKYPEISPRAVRRGYIHVRNLLLWHSCPANEYNIYNKALLCVNLDKKSSELGRLYGNPSTKSDYTQLNTDMNFYFIMKREGNMVLLAGQHSMDGLVDETVLTGWVADGSYVPWDQRSCLEPTWDRNDVEAFADNKVRYKIYHEEDRQMRGEPVVDEDFTKKIKGQGEKYKYRMMPHLLRFPILSTSVSEKGDTIYKCSTFGTATGGRNQISQLENKTDYSGVTDATIKDMSNIDIAIVIDGTKSMGPYFQAVKQGIKDAEMYFESDKFNIRVGLVIYRDYTDGEQYAVEVYPFMDSRSRKLAELLDKGGSGYGFKSSSRDKTMEEALYLGIDTALEELDFNPKHSNLMFVIGDCGNHRDDKKFSREDLVSKIVAKEVNLMGFQVNLGQAEAFDSFNSQILYLMNRSLLAKYQSLAESSTVQWKETLDGYEFQNSHKSNLYTGKHYGPKRKGQVMETERLTALMREAIEYFKTSLDTQRKIISSVGFGGNAFVEGVKINENFARKKLGDEAYEQAKNGHNLLAFQGYTRKKVNGKDVYKPVLFISSQELESLLKQLQGVNAAAAELNDREPYINAMKALVLSLSPGLTEEQIQNTEIGEVMKMVMGLNEAPDALKRYTLADIGNTRKVKPDEYRSLVNKFARRYENLSRISRTDYKYTYKANNMKYYWLPIEYLP